VSSVPQGSNGSHLQDAPQFNAMKETRIMSSYGQAVGERGQHDVALPAGQRAAFEVIGPNSSLSSWYCSIAHRWLRSDDRGRL